MKFYFDVSIVCSLDGEEYDVEAGSIYSLNDVIEEAIEGFEINPENDDLIEKIEILRVDILENGSSEDMGYYLDFVDLNEYTESDEGVALLSELSRLGELGDEDGIVVALWSEYENGELDYGISSASKGNYIIFSDKESMIEQFMEIYDVKENVRPYLDDDAIINDLFKAEELYSGRYLEIIY